MTPETRIRLTPQFIMGIGLVVFGVLLTLDRFDLLPVRDVVRLWPIGFVVLGAWILGDRRDPRARMWGVGLVFLGVWLMLNAFGILHVGIAELLWPFLLILLGVRLINQTARGRDSGRRVNVAESFGSTATAVSASGGAMSLFAVLGGTKRTVQGRFEGAEMTAALGGCQLDLREAVIDPGQSATVNMFAVMGGHEVRVPPLWNVVSEVVPVLGGVDDKRLPPVHTVADTSPAIPPRLVLRGVVMMGGLVIKS
jgi:hypothetical protein